MILLASFVSGPRAEIYLVRVCVYLACDTSYVKGIIYHLRLFLLIALLYCYFYVLISSSTQIFLLILSYFLVLRSQRSQNRCFRPC